MLEQQRRGIKVPRVDRGLRCGVPQWRQSTMLQCSSGTFSALAQVQQGGVSALPFLLAAVVATGDSSAMASV